MMRRAAATAAALALAAGCAQAVRTSGSASASCSGSGSPSDALLRTAVNAIASGSGRGVGQLRDLAEVAPLPDSIRSRAQVVTDESSCRAAGQTAEVWHARDQYDVLRIGRTYWVRGTSWHYVNVLDDRFRRIESYADAD